MNWRRYLLLQWRSSLAELEQILHLYKQHFPLLQRPSQVLFCRSLTLESRLTWTVSSTVAAATASMSASGPAFSDRSTAFEKASTKAVAEEFACAEAFPHAVPVPLRSALTRVLAKASATAKPIASASVRIKGSVSNPALYATNVLLTAFSMILLASLYASESAVAVIFAEPSVSWTEVLAAAGPPPPRAEDEETTLIEPEGRIPANDGLDGYLAMLVVD